MEKVYDYLMFKALCAKHAAYNFIYKDERGAADIIAVIVLIGIVIAVAVIFKDKITTYVGNLFDANAPVESFTGTK
jgi:FlaG/FlaF family flagellin (archaellin)